MSNPLNLAQSEGRISGSDVDSPRRRLNGACVTSVGTAIIVVKLGVSLSDLDGASAAVSGFTVSISSPSGHSRPRQSAPASIPPFLFPFITARSVIKNAFVARLVLYHRSPCLETSETVLYQKNIKSFFRFKVCK